MTKILGLDLGTNSIGWALIEKSNDETGRILGLGARILPMGIDKTNFESGNAYTRNADRRTARGIRRMNHRFKLRRNKLIYVLDQIGMLPEFIKFQKPFPDPLRLQELDILPIKKECKQLSALEIYELRTKALYEKISPAELGRLILLFNQLRGYSGGQGEEDHETKNEIKEEEKEKSYEILLLKSTVINFIKSERQERGKDVFEMVIRTEDGEEYAGTTTIASFHENEEEEIEIRIRRPKHGEPTIKFSRPFKTNWRKNMESLEDELSKAITNEGKQMTLGEFIYNKLKDGEWNKTRNRVILRHRYLHEFDEIWKAQKQFHPVLENIEPEKLSAIANYLFPGKKETQEKYRKEAIVGGLFHILRNQIIYYQRPLKSQQDLISNCRFEKEEKVIPKSHPLFQKFMIWQKINDLSINSIRVIDGKNQYIQRNLTQKDSKELFDELQLKKEISFTTLYRKLGLVQNMDYLNGLLSGKGKLKGNETRILLRKTVGEDLYQKLNLEDETELIAFWEILFHGEGNEYDPTSERNQAIRHFISNRAGELDEKQLIAISKIKFKRDYGSLSAKAISNLLVFMSTFEGYTVDFGINQEMVQKIEHLETGETDTSIENALREYYFNYPEAFSFGGMQYAYAAMLVYGVHTGKRIEVADTKKNYHEIRTLEHGGLRNPIVEQIINETLQQIKGIWKHFGFKPDEIRVELARDLKNNAEQRKKITEAIQKATKENDYNAKELRNFGISVTATNLLKYKLWKQQKECCPYTGKTIALNGNDGLFSGYFDIDHIIPQSRLFDDSISNKVVVRKEINLDKGNRTAWEYISTGSAITDKLSQDAYIDYITSNYFGRKRKNLLLKKIPDDFIERQKKDTQYISVRVKEELAGIVGSENVHTTTGQITDYLRQQWGLAEVFKEITKDRFASFGKQLNEEWVEMVFNPEKNKHELKIKNWSKRYDHRNHAMDALVVACTNQQHVHNLNNLNKKLQSWLVSNKDKIFPNFTGDGEAALILYNGLPADQREAIQRQIKGFRYFDPPWKGFHEEAETKLKATACSIKLRPKLLFQKNEKTGNEFLKIRGALHKETIYGSSGNRRTFRVPLAKLGEMAKGLYNLVDIRLKSDLEQHVSKYETKKEAFSPDGIHEFNKNRKFPVNSVKIRFSKDASGDDEGVLQRIDRKKAHNSSLFVSIRDNYCFAVIEKKCRRYFQVLTFFDAVNLINEDIHKGNKDIDLSIRNFLSTLAGEGKVLFTLSHNETVYLPESDDTNIPLDKSDENYHEFWSDITARSKRLFNVVKFSGTTCYFIPVNMAEEINIVQVDLNNMLPAGKKVKNIKVFEFGSYKDCSPYTLDSQYTPPKQVKIQDYCIKVRIDRLGRIEPI